MRHKGPAGRRPAERNSRGSAVLAGTAALAIVLIGCGASAVHYRGTYTRAWMDAHGNAQQVSGPVTLVLGSGGRYQVAGEKIDLPPEGSGRYERHGGYFIFRDTAPPRAGFDLSLILQGGFEVAEDGAALILSQENTWGDSHLLILERSDQ
jgi:hypothetical protein